MDAAHAQLTHIRITNPFNPNERVSEPFPFTGGMTIADMFPLGLAGETVVSLNGKIVPEEDFGKYYLAVGDHVVSCPVPAGGGGGSKQILRLVAILAVAIIAPYAAGVIGPMMGIAAGSFGMAALTAGITFAGTMLVNALLPVKPLQPGSTPDQTRDSPTYGVDGPKNTATEGLPVPLCYGEFGMAGNLLNYYTENINNSQILYVLVNAGEGPVADITDIKLNDQPIDSYQDVEWQTRLGEAEQEVIPWFESQITPESVSQKLSTSWTTHAMLAEAEKLRFDFVCPAGLYKVNKDSGSLEEMSVTIEIQYRKVGDPDWIIAGDTSTITTSSVDPVPVTITEDDPEGGLASGGTNQSTQTVTYGSSLTITEKSRSAVRRSFSTPNLEFAEYEVRVRRTTEQSTDELIMDEVWISDVNRILLDPVAYNNTALVAIKVKLTDQLSGLPKITYTNHGRLLRVWDAGTKSWKVEQSNNPAWICLDMMTSKRYGGGIAEARIDLERFKDWAAYCVDEEHTFRGVLDTQSNVWDAMQYPLRCGHAQVYNIGTRYSVVIERATDPSMLFTTANMIEGSYKETWLSSAERANEIEVSFFDETDDYRQRTVKVFDGQALAAQGRQKTANITLVGVTSAERAWYEGFVQLAMNRFILKTVEFEAPLEAIACTIGDVILVQHDMPDYAQAGRCETGSTTTVVKIDREVIKEIGKTYSLLVLHPAVQRASGTISSVTSTTVTLSGLGAISDTHGLRLKANGKDVEVIDINGSVVTVSSTTDLSSGQAYTLWATDVMEEKAVTAVSGREVTLSAPLTMAPEAFAHWMYGETTLLRQPFRVRQLSGGNNELSRRIIAVQYDERVYDPTSIPGFGQGSGSEGGENPATLPLSHAINLAVSEYTFATGATVQTDVTLTWDSGPNGVYKGADIYFKRNSSAWEAPVPVVGNPRKFVVQAVVGDQLQWKVWAFDVNNIHAEPESAAPIIGYTVTGENTPPNTGNVTGVEVIWNGKHCNLYWRFNSLTNSYEFGSEPYGADSGYYDPSFLNYDINIHRSTGGNGPTTGVFLRHDTTMSPHYTYLFDSNYSDNQTALPKLLQQRLLRFEIRLRDIFNSLSEPFLIDALNPQSVLANQEPVVAMVANAANFEYARPSDPDFSGVRIWLDTDPDFTPSTANLLYDGTDDKPLVPNLTANTIYYYYIAGYDVFDKEGLTLRGPFSFDTGDVATGGGSGCALQGHEWTTTGSYSWTVPSDITSIWVNGIGAGAGGSRVGGGNGGGSGGSGEYGTMIPMMVVGGETLTIEIGQGGAGSAPSTVTAYGSDGEQTRVIGSLATIGLLGGKASASGSPGAGGRGGGPLGASNISGIGSVGGAEMGGYFGGSSGSAGGLVAGAVGVIGSAGVGAGGVIAGGAGGAPSGATCGGAGGPATMFGPGGDGGAASGNGAAAPSTSYGAGGGGAGGGAGSTAGGAGADGWVMIQWVGQPA